jgi:hypothetical protein
MTLLLICGIALALFRPHTAALAAEAPPDPSLAVAYQRTEVDDSDDTRVEVQLVVLGIVVGVVFVFGTMLYLLRRRLGLVPPPPEQGADAHH